MNFLANAIKSEKFDYELHINIIESILNLFDGITVLFYIGECPYFSETVYIKYLGRSVFHNYSLWTLIDEPWVYAAYSCTYQSQ